MALYGWTRTFDENISQDRQGHLTRASYKDTHQGPWISMTRAALDKELLTRTSRKNILQEHLTRTYCKDILQGHLARTSYKDILQGHLTRTSDKVMAMSPEISVMVRQGSRGHQGGYGGRQAEGNDED